MDIQPVSVPAPAEPRRSHKRLIITIIGVLVVIGILAAFLFSPLGDQLKISKALQGVGIAEGNYYSVTPERFGWFGMEKATAGSVADYARGYYLLATEGSGTSVITPNGTTLADDGTVKAGLAVSPDGKYLAYAVLTTPSETGQATGLLSAWTVRVHELETGDTFDAGAGFGPQFFTRDGKAYLLLTSQLGPTIADLAARTSMTSFIVNEGTVDAAADISADGTYLVMQNPVNERYTVYEVSAIAPALTLSPIRTIEAQLIDVLWKGNALIGITEPVNGSVSISDYQIAADANDMLITSFGSSAPYRLISL